MSLSSGEVVEEPPRLTSSKNGATPKNIFLDYFVRMEMMRVIPPPLPLKLLVIIMNLPTERPNSLDE